MKRSILAQCRGQSLPMQMLAKIWSDLTIDGYPVVSTYVEEQATHTLTSKTPEWKTQMQESQYMLQIVKCKHRTCCTETCSSYFSLMEDFVPGSLPLDTSPDRGLHVTASGKYPSLFINVALKKDVLPRSADFKNGLPYDFACPGIQDKLAQRVCKKCGIYHASVKSLNSHKKTCGHAKDQDVPHTRVWPVRVAAKCQRELMCVVQYMQEEEFEWLDEADVEGPTNAAIQTIESGTPVMCLDSRVSPWVPE